MKIVFFGSSEFSIPILEALLSSNDQVAQVVTTPDKPKGRGQKVTPSIVKSYAEKKHISAITPNKLNQPDVLDGIKNLKPDFLVVASYGKLVPDSLLKIPKVIPLNVHPSLIPKYRGASPIQSAILAGDKTTGLTIMEVTDRLDAGDIFGQIETPIDEVENALQLSERLAHLGADLLLKVIAQFKQDKVSRTPQDDSKASYAKKIERDSGRIDWMKPASLIHNQVRAYYPWPSAYTFFRGKRLKILKTKLDSVRHCESRRDEAISKIEIAASASRPPRNDGSGVPGTIVINEFAKTVCVQTRSGFLEILQVQMEGKREMTSFEFAIGQRIKPNERFES